MALGCDTATALTSTRVNTLVNSNYTFVGRYLDGSYKMTSSEATTISNGGLNIVSIWEKGSPTSASYFTADKGKSDAEAAIKAAIILDQPYYNTPIYFAVDYDASDSDISGPINAYLQAVKQTFNYWEWIYELGLYGSGAVLSYFKDTFPCTWLVGATGWRGYKTYTGWAIKQYDNNTPIGDFTIDKDTSNGSEGGWQL